MTFNSLATSCPSAPITCTSIANVRAFDGIRALNGSVSINFDSDGWITLDGAQEPCNIIDGTGMTILPGLWDSHVHVSDYTPQSTENSIPLLIAMVNNGITAAVDCGRMEQKQYDYINSRSDLIYLRYTGNLATATGSTHTKVLKLDAESIVDSVENATRFVKQRVQQGSDYIKIIADVPGPSQDVINRLSKEARAYEKPTIVHAASIPAFNMALLADPPINIITHVPMTGLITQEDAKKMAELGITAVPTLVMAESFVKSGTIPGLTIEPALENVRRMHAAGVKILVGTDSNREFIGIEHGKAIHREIELLQQAGLGLTEILHAATWLSAQSFGTEDRGLIASGKRADLVLVGGDATQDLAVLRNVRRVWKAGKEIYSADAVEGVAVVGEGTV